jgi:hypothetical protein
LTSQTSGCREETLLVVFDQVDAKALNELVIRFREGSKLRAVL